MRQLGQHSGRAFWRPGLCSEKSSKCDVRQAYRAMGYQNLRSLPPSGSDPLRPGADPAEPHVAHRIPRVVSPAPAGRSPDGHRPQIERVHLFQSVM